LPVGLNGLTCAARAAVKNSELRFGKRN